MSPRPLWRWWLFRLGLWLHFRGMRFGLRLVAWAPLRGWFGDGVDAPCSCSTDVDDPGPVHLASCPYSDPNYDGSPF